MSSSATPSATAAATTSAAAKALTASPNLKVVGVILAIASGFLIGSSFVFKKKGLIRAQAGHEAGEGVAYLKSPLWWTGMSMMILGEICNFAAYAFVEAIVVTPFGALSVVICAILSSIFLKETLTFFGWLGCVLCIIGSVIIALNGPQENSVGHIKDFEKLFLNPGFLVYISLLIGASLVIIIFFAPKYGKDSMLWYISVCSMIGGISVSVTTGLGAAIVTTALGDDQFKFWFLYFLLAFVVITLLTEVYYLNVALALFNTAMVTPTYYVMFTFCSIITTIVLFQGLKASPAQIITLVMAFLVICVGITILQMSKVDPVHLSKLDRRSTILLQAARNKTENMEEKSFSGIEDPGMDALRGSFGTVGSIIRARSARRMSQSSHGGRPNATSFRSNPNGSSPAPYDPESNTWTPTHRLAPDSQLTGMTRHQLYDAPVPRSDSLKSPSLASSAQLAPPTHRTTIKFDSQDVVHQYHPPGTGDDTATHQHRSNLRGMPYPPGRTQLSPSETKLVEDIDGLPETLSAGGSLRQTVSVPPFVAEEHLVHSAPPTVNPRYGGRLSRADSRELFDKSPSTGTLLSFPSVTDSGLSAAGTFEDDDTDERGRGRTTKKNARYPRGEGDDDREESVSLWQRRSESDDRAEVDDTPLPAGGGIRLVQPSRNRF